MKNNAKILLFLSSIMIAALTAPSIASGENATQTYSFTKQPFHAIELAGSADMKVQVTHQPKTANATITTDSNLLPHIKVYVHNNTLYIGKRDEMDFYPTKKIKVMVNVENLTSIITRGSGNVQVDNIGTKKFSIAIHGAGNTFLTGEVKDLAINITGSGKINAKKLIAQEVKAVINGSGNILANTAQKINAEINGSGRIEYYGSPTEVKQTIHGSGTIITLP